MHALKNQLGWTHVFGPRHPSEPVYPLPHHRKPIHGPKPKSRTSVQLRTGLRDLFREYCSTSTVHGVSYISSRRSRLERIWWFVVIVLAVYGCGRLIEKVYRKWDENPVIVSFDEQPTPVWTIPFPAITICPAAKIRSELMNFTESFYRFAYGTRNETLDQASLDELLAVLQICDRFFHSSVQNLSFDGVKSTVDLVSVLRRLSILQNDTFMMCKMHGFSCSKMFTQTITEEGVCFTYNGFSQNDMFRKGVLHGDYEYLTETKTVTNWSLEDGFKFGTPLGSHPIRAFGAGFGAGLTVQLMSFNSDIEQHCREEQGFKVMLHSPNDYPRVQKNFVLVTLARDITIAVRPLIVRTADALRSYSPKRRQCYFSWERELKFFRIYSQSNCELECITNFTLKICGCVKFSMPRSNGTRMCSTWEMKCVLGAQPKLLKKYAQQRLKNLGNFAVPCNCIPSCTALLYDAEITQSTYDFQRTLELRYAPIWPPIRDFISKKQISKLGIYFKEAMFLSSKRNEVYGTIDFVANCGGILGLCLGISLFSLVELLYYCLVRPLMLVRQSIEVKPTVIQVTDGINSRF
ncbi:pickpocket protein 28-like [Topomyia yanbarensis]|uniref:pickpocket protein 28-like n=1 Tax=Topomyia yanbarensis TaxID=2498891 RepID=UPI00273CA00F|nr:pickpocket protein 28-like [Topomyia yanbarensis]